MRGGSWRRGATRRSPWAGLPANYSASIDRQISRARPTRGSRATTATGLLWLLQGRRVIALTDSTAAIQNPSTGNVLTYRKARKPAYGPLGDSLDDFTA